MVALEEAVRSSRWWFVLRHGCAGPTTHALDRSSFVMAGPCRGHLRTWRARVKEDVDNSDKRGHDEMDGPSPSWPGVVPAIHGLEPARQ